MAGKLSQNLTILLTDIKGFTEKTSHKSRADILTMLENHKEIVLPVLEGKGGRLVKTIGDAFLMVFESPTDAVLAGMAVQEALAVFNKDKKGDDRIDVRIAINTGEVTLSDDDIFGDPVNITARIEGIAEAGEVFFTEAVYLAMNKQEVPSSEVGLLQLKGIPEKVRVYKVVSEEPVEEHPGVKMPVAPLKKGLLDALRPRAPKAVVAGEPPSPDAPKVSMWRRTAALAVDAIIVSILAGMLFGKESANIHVTHRGGERAKKAGIQVNEQGIKIGDSIKIDEKGVKVGDGIQIDEDGVRIGG
ncbi:MAG: adenylate/guanylate cyclase domain-containing protein, partial [Elusimicrobiota bacterium]